MNTPNDLPPRGVPVLSALFEEGGSEYSGLARAIVTPPEQGAPERPIWMRLVTDLRRIPGQRTDIGDGARRLAAAAQAERDASEAIVRAAQAERDAAEKARQHCEAAARHDAEALREADAADLARNRKKARAHDEAARRASALAANERAAATAAEEGAIGARADANAAVRVAAIAQMRALRGLEEGIRGWFAVAIKRQERRGEVAERAARREARER